MADSPPILAVLASLIRAGYLPLDQQLGVDRLGHPRHDQSYLWRERVKTMHGQAWRVLRACGEVGTDGKISGVDGDLLNLVLALIEAGELPYWMGSAWQNRLDGVVQNARFLVEQSKCEDCAIATIKRELGLKTQPDPLASFKAARDARLARAATLRSNGHGEQLVPKPVDVAGRRDGSDRPEESEPAQAKGGSGS